MRTAAVRLLLIGVIAGCGSRTPDYFPLERGAQRVMEVTEQRTSGAETTRVTRVEVVETVKGRKEMPGTGQVWVIEAPLDSNRTVNYFFQRRKDSLLMVVPGRGGRPERILHMLLPLRVGRRWFDSEERRESCEVVGKETVTVPAGTFAGCFRIVQQSLRLDSRVERWLAPGVGLVRRVKSLSWLDDSVFYSIQREERLVEYRVPDRRRGRTGLNPPASP
ncbi:MAG: hypothetical protein ABIK43_05485 [candidate division WOR-3 bacterium]